MTIELKNEILLNITKFKYSNTSYREYKAVYKNYLVCVWPFAIHIYEILKPSNIEALSWASYVFSECFKKIFDLHHIDWLKYGIDPCDVYEEVSGYKIHSGESDDMSVSEECYHKQINELNVKILHNLRIEKLNKIKNI